MYITSRFVAGVSGHPLFVVGGSGSRQRLMGHSQHFTRCLGMVGGPSHRQKYSVSRLSYLIKYIHQLITGAVKLSKLYT